MSRNNASNKKPTKAKFFTFILYPDNAYHMEYLHFIENSETGFYIVHEKGDELANIPYAGVQTDIHESHGKKHIHVLIEYKNPRTLHGVLNSFPVMRYYENTQYRQLFTVYDVPYTSLPVQEVYKRLVEHAEIVSDPYALAKYFLHQDFLSICTGKKQYDFTDIKPLNVDTSYLSKYFNDYVITDAEIVDIIQQLYAMSDSTAMFIQLCCMHSNEKVLKYVQSHAYFIKTFIIENNRKEVLIDD